MVRSTGMPISRAAFGLTATARIAALPLQPDAASGRGLYLIHNCFDDVRWSSRGNRLQLAVSRQRAELLTPADGWGSQDQPARP